MLLKFHIQAFLQHAQGVVKRNTDDDLIYLLWYLGVTVEETSFHVWRWDEGW